MSSINGYRHRCSHSQVVDTGAVTVMLLSRLLDGIMIFILAIVDHWYRSSFNSPSSHLVVMILTDPLISASCHVPFVQSIDMLSAVASSSTSHHAPPSRASLLCLCSPGLCLSLHLSYSLASTSCYASASHHVPFLWLIVVILSSAPSVSAACMAITCPLLLWLIVMLFMQSYCLWMAIGE
jgi:hypothetical protein